MVRLRYFADLGTDTVKGNRGSNHVLRNIRATRKVTLVLLAFRIMSTIFVVFVQTQITSLNLLQMIKNVLSLQLEHHGQTSPFCLNSKINCWDFSQQQSCRGRVICGSSCRSVGRKITQPVCLNSLPVLSYSYLIMGFVFVYFSANFWVNHWVKVVPSICLSKIIICPVYSVTYFVVICSVAPTHVPSINSELKNGYLFQVESSSNVFFSVRHSKLHLLSNPSGCFRYHPRRCCRVNQLEDVLIITIFRTTKAARPAPWMGQLHNGCEWRVDKMPNLKPCPASRFESGARYGDRDCREEANPSSSWWLTAKEQF